MCVPPAKHPGLIQRHAAPGTSPPCQPRVWSFLYLFKSSSIIYRSNPSLCGAAGAPGSQAARVPPALGTGALVGWPRARCRWTQRVQSPPGTPSPETRHAGSSDCPLLLRAGAASRKRGAPLPKNRILQRGAPASAGAVPPVCPHLLGSPSAPHPQHTRSRPLWALSFFFFFFHFFSFFFHFFLYFTHQLDVTVT